MTLPKLPGAKGVVCRLLAVALAVCSVSDGRTSRVAYAQGASDPTVVKARAEINRGQYAAAETLLNGMRTRDRSDATKRERDHD